MSTEVAAGQEASAEMEGKRGMLGGLADTAKEVISLPFEPVVGGRPANVSFRLLALGIIGLGISSLVNATQTWGIPVSEIAVSYETELFYPDFYVCLPEVYAKEFDTDKALLVGSGFSESEGTQKAIRKTCDMNNGLNKVGASAPIKMDPTKNDGYYKKIDHRDACTYGRASQSGLPTSKLIAGVSYDEVQNWMEEYPQSLVPIIKGEDCRKTPYPPCTLDPTLLKKDPRVVEPFLSTDKTGKFDAKVKKLTDALKNETGADTVFCSYYPAGGGTKDSKSQKASEGGRYKMMMQAYQEAAILKNAPFIEAYLAEPGVDPVDSNGVVNASQILFAGFGVTSLAQLEMRQIKDETKGDKAFKTYYLASMWNRPEAEDVDTVYGDIDTMGKMVDTVYGVPRVFEGGAWDVAECNTGGSRATCPGGKWVGPIYPNPGGAWDVAECNTGRQWSCPGGTMVGGTMVGGTWKIKKAYAKINQKHMTFGFYFNSFLVQKITIRKKSFTEVYAEIGGIWGASLAVLALLFVKSGKRNKKGKEAYIFKYYPGSVKKQVLNAFTAANDVPYTAAEGLELKTSRLKAVSPA